MSLNLALQARKCKQLSAHNFVVDFCLQTTSTIGKVLWCRSPFRSLPSSPIRRTMTQMRCRKSLISSLNTSLISISVGADNPSCRKPLGSVRSFSLTGTIFLSIRSHLLVFSRADHTTTFHVVFITTFTEGLLQKASMSLRPPLIGSTAVMSHIAVISDPLFRSLVKYTLLNKNASSCSAIRPNY